MKRRFDWILVACFLIVAVSVHGDARAGTDERLAILAGGGAVMAVGADGRVLVSHRPDKPLVPASVLKIVTAAAAMEVLGPGYRFETLFRRTPEGDLVVSGRGDPHLVSEELERIAGALKSKGLKRVRHVLLDNRYFEPGLVLHGTNRSLNPYDAYNGALCVNFNTICVRVDSRGSVKSAEPQTPLTDLACRAALDSGMKGRVRLNLVASPEQCLLYAGELLQAFLREKGISVDGEVRRCEEDPEAFPRLYVHRSTWTLEELLEKMFRHSNNFMANQIFLAMGASRFGPPATPEKARCAVDRFLKAAGIEGVHMEEGSGLSRRTRITARQMIRVLERFRPHRRLLEYGQRAWTKTGTLHDVKSLAGYLALETGGPVAFVILLNGEGHGYRSRERIFSFLRDELLFRPPHKTP
ncbi:MAG: D-alanyl-D-alanine carboxypeptidase [Deltaproteobacteria bacterium]|nr:D-alanyl-D-alanine carboxypeptidase [Deltaproteobacteria bacterium]